MASAGKRILFIVEHLPSPFDRRVWQEATTLQQNGYQVAIICPTGKGYEKKYEYIEHIHIYRHSLPLEAEGAVGYALEYGAALFWEFYLSFKVLFKHGFAPISKPSTARALRSAVVEDGEMHQPVETIHLLDGGSTHASSCQHEGSD